MYIGQKQKILLPFFNFFNSGSDKTNFDTHKFINVVVSLSKSLFSKCKCFIMKIEINTSYQTFVFIRYRRNLFIKVKVMVLFVLMWQCSTVQYSAV